MNTEIITLNKILENLKTGDLRVCNDNLRVYY